MNYTDHTHTIYTPDYGQRLYRQEYPLAYNSATTNPRYHRYADPRIDPRTLPDGDLTLAARAARNEILKAQGERQEKMDTLNKLRAERKEKREREKLEKQFARFDELALGDYEPSTILRITLRGKEKNYTYAAVFADDLWYVTGITGPNGVDTEDFIVWMIRLGIETGDVEVTA